MALVKPHVERGRCNCNACEIRRLEAALVEAVAREAALRKAIGEAARLACGCVGCERRGFACGPSQLAAEEAYEARPDAAALLAARDFFVAYQRRMTAEYEADTTPTAENRRRAAELHGLAVEAFGVALGAQETAAKEAAK